MSESSGKRDARSLVSAILAQTQGDAPAPESVAAAEDEAPRACEGEARELFEVYFEAEDPLERDVVFDKLLALKTPLVDDFLRVMMTEDEDEYLRSAAALELARRGVEEAAVVLEGDLEDPDELYFFANAVEGLSALRGAAFYETLREIWREADRDLEQHRCAMLGMEALDEARALGDFVAFVEEQRDAAAISEDRLEAVIVAFARHAHEAGKEALAALRARLGDDEAHAELCAIVQEGLDLVDEALSAASGA